MKMRIPVASALASVLLATSLAAVAPGVVARSADETPGMTRPDLLEQMPRTMGGFEPDIYITRGDEHLANLDLANADDAATAAELERLFNDTGVTVDDMTSGYAHPNVCAG